MRVLIHSESFKGKPVYGQLGARRWECEWYELSKGAQKRFDADPNYEHDHDRDEVCRVSIHATKEAAIEAGRKVAPGSVYGCALVQEHFLDWMVEEDGVGEWESVGPQFEVDAVDGEVVEV